MPAHEIAGVVDISFQVNPVSAILIGRDGRAGTGRFHRFARAERQRTISPPRTTLP